MGYCKKDVTPLLTHWSYVFLAITHRHDARSLSAFDRTHLAISTGNRQQQPINMTNVPEPVGVRSYSNRWECLLLSRILSALGAHGYKLISLLRWCDTEFLWVVSCWWAETLNKFFVVLYCLWSIPRILPMACNKWHNVFAETARTPCGLSLPTSIPLVNWYMYHQ